MFFSLPLRADLHVTNGLSEVSGGQRLSEVHGLLKSKAHIESVFRLSPILSEKRFSRAWQ